MVNPTITYLVFVVVTIPWVEGQFPRVCTDRDSLRDKNVVQFLKASTHYVVTMEAEDSARH